VKELTIILFCTWKFAAMFPIAVLAMKMSFFETIIYTNIGGALGAVIFTFFSSILIETWNKYLPVKFKLHKKPKRVFTKRKRFLVKIKVKYGLTGIVVLTPLILSIPVGSFLVAKYYGRKKINIAWLISGQIVWSFIYTYLYKQAEAVV
jgi:hypothetical protein